MFNFVHENNCKHVYRQNASMLTENKCKFSYMSKIGDVLKQARNSLGLSQGVVASEIRKRLRHPFSREALSQIESGTTKNPRPAHLMACCNALGIDLESAIKGKLQWLTVERIPDETKIIEEELQVSEEESARKEVMMLSERLSAEQINQWVEFGKFMLHSADRYHERKVMHLRKIKRKDMGIPSSRGNLEHEKDVENSRDQTIRLLGVGGSNKTET